MVAPDRGDLVLVTILPPKPGQAAEARPSADPTAVACGGERRAALVVSPERYNRRSGLALMCAIAGRAKGYPFEVALPEGGPVAGVVLSDHLRSTDWRARRAEVLGRVPARVVADVLAKLKPL